jgi:hypothetical protein
MKALQGGQVGAPIGTPRTTAEMALPVGTAKTQ